MNKSQNNQIGFDDKGKNQHKQAMQNLEGQTGLQGQVTRETKKENVGAFMDYEINKAGYDRADTAPESDVQKLYEKKLGKKNNRALFKDQNREFYLNHDGSLKQEVVSYLHERSQGMNQDARAKMADAGFFKDQQVYQKLAETEEGRFILGIEERGDNKATKNPTGFL